MIHPHRVLVTGATGYLGSRLVPLLRDRGHDVTAVIRPGAEPRRAVGGQVCTADPLRTGSYVHALRGADTLIHLIGVRHPSPARARQFIDVDVASVEVAVHAAIAAGIGHFVYLGVAHPAPVMRDYVAARMACERMIRTAGIPATLLRPWYVLGPGHRWPQLLQPAYWLLEKIPATRDTAQRLGLVTLPQMIQAMTWAVEHPPDGTRILEVPHIRAPGTAAAT